VGASSAILSCQRLPPRDTHYSGPMTPAAPTPTPRISRPTIICGTEYDAAMITAPTVKLNFVSQATMRTARASSQDVGDEKGETSTKSVGQSTQNSRAKDSTNGATSGDDLLLPAGKRVSQVAAYMWKSDTNDSSVIAEQETRDGGLSSVSQARWGARDKLTTAIKKIKYGVTLSSFSARTKFSSYIVSEQSMQEHS